MIIMGIDPGNSITGYGLMDMNMTNGNLSYITHGVIRDHMIKYPTSLVFIPREIKDLVKEYEPKIVVIEGPKHIRGFRSHQVQVELIGTIKHVLVSSNRSFVEMPPTTLKKIVSGNGWATKEEVARSISTILGISYERLIEVEYYKSGKKKGQVKKEILDGTDALGLLLAFPTFIKKVKNLDFTAVGGKINEP